MCQIMKYTCEDGWGYFGDNIWCGCEKDKVSKETKIKIDTLLDSFVWGLRDKNYSEEKIGEILREVSIRLQILRETRPEYIDIINHTLQRLDSY